MARGKFITVEGVDGAGKSTHLPHLVGSLEARGVPVLSTREPGGTPLAERLRGIVLSEPMDGIAEVLLMFAARRDHVRQVIEPALARGTWVVCDRFTDATYAYQGAGKNTSAALISFLENVTHPGLSPDATLVFDCPFEVAALRLAAKGEAPDRFEREGRAFFERVRSAYRSRATEEPGRIHLIDASRSLDEVRDQVEEVIKKI